MSEQSITAAILGAVLLVGLVGVVGLVKSDVTGAFSQPLQRNACICEVTQYDSYGNAVNAPSAQVLYVNSRQTDEQCQNRCDQHFGKVRSSRGWQNSVVGHSLF